MNWNSISKCLPTHAIFCESFGTFVGINTFNICMINLEQIQPKIVAKAKKKRRKGLIENDPS